MRPQRVAASLALTVALASVIGVAAVGSQQPTSFRPVEQGFRPIVLAGAPTMAIPPGPADPSAGPLSGDGRFLEPSHGGDPTARPSIAQPAPSPGVIAVPAGPSWRSDPNVSWYGPGFYGLRTACGQTLTTSLIGVASRTLPCGTLVTFRNPADGRVVTAPVVDRGPFVSGRQWDLTGGLCLALVHCYTGSIDWHL